MKEGGSTEERGESNFDSYSFPSPPSSICPLTHPSQKLPLSSSTSSPIAPPHPEHCVKDSGDSKPESYISSILSPSHLDPLPPQPFFLTQYPLPSLRPSILLHCFTVNSYKQL